jgi:hypothetical protein
MRNLLLATLLVLLPVGPGEAAKTDALMAYAVDVGGAGIYLGRGFVITAAHVGGKLGERRNVTLAGNSVGGKWIKVGTFEETDISILELDDVLLPDGLRGLRPLSLCTNPVKPDEAVLVVAPGTVAPARVAEPAKLAHHDDPLFQRFSTVIDNPDTTGNSGSGVFDAGRKCLLGIISRKLSATFVISRNGEQSRETHLLGKYFVPASEIRQFVRTIPELKTFFH